jgi:hypothetical protein
VPDTADYEGHIFARLKSEKRLLEKFDIAQFEQRWLPGAKGLLEAKKITQKELEYFENSYFKVSDNNSYYFAEDQFDTQRNNAVAKIHNLLELPSGWMESVLHFNIKAAPEYLGFGASLRKYPNAYTTFNDASNTRIISPLAGTVKAGSVETFSVSSKDFSRIAIIVNGEFHFFTKNQAGDFILEFQIPENIDRIIISGSRDARNYNGLVWYDVTD